MDQFQSPGTTCQCRHIRICRSYLFIDGRQVFNTGHLGKVQSQFICNIFSIIEIRSQCDTFVRRNAVDSAVLGRCFKKLFANLIHRALRMIRNQIRDIIYLIVGDISIQFAYGIENIDLLPTCHRQTDLLCLLTGCQWHQLYLYTNLLSRNLIDCIFHGYSGILIRDPVHRPVGIHNLCIIAAALCALASHGLVCGQLLRCYPVYRIPPWSERRSLPSQVPTISLYLSCSS